MGKQKDRHSANASTTVETHTNIFISYDQKLAHRMGRSSSDEPAPGQAAPESSTSTLSRTQKKKLRKKLGRARAIEAREVLGCVVLESRADQATACAQGLRWAAPHNHASPAHPQAGTPEPITKRVKVSHEEGEASTDVPVGTGSQVSTQGSIVIKAETAAETAEATAATRNGSVLDVSSLHALLLQRFLAPSQPHEEGSIPTPRIPTDHPAADPASTKGRFAAFGNYHRYYGYRLGQAFEADPRLRLMERAWFARKRCMDVGCNEGVLTLALAQEYASQSMVGVDLDAALIKKACTCVGVGWGAVVEYLSTFQAELARAEHFIEVSRSCS